MTDTPFDHDAHADKLERASAALYNVGLHDLAAAVAYARKLHFNAHSRVASAAHALRQVNALAPLVTREDACKRVLHVQGFLRHATEAQGPAIGVLLYPDMAALIEGKSSL